MSNSMDVQSPQLQSPRRPTMKITFLMIISCFTLAAGSTAAPLLLRLYFLRGGTRKWLSSWLQNVGWPLALVPLSHSYLHRQKTDPNAKFFSITPSLFWASAVLGLLTGVDSFMLAYGMAFLPVSTSSLLTSTQLVFNAVFAIPLVKQKFTPHTINAIVLLTLGAALLGVHNNGDRPPGTSSAQYLVGFFMTLGASALYGLVLPLIQIVYMKAKGAVTLDLVMEVQMVICIFATALCTVGMLVNNDFQVIAREANEYELGKAKYYVVIVACAISMQLLFMAMVWVVAFSSALHAGFLSSSMMPVTEILPVAFFHEKFNVEKGISLILCLWGSSSYLYGEYMKSKQEKEKKGVQVETDQFP